MSPRNKRKPREEDSEPNKQASMEESPVQEISLEEEVEPDVMAAAIETMQSELEALKKEATESHDRYLRVLADFDNFRKRQREETARRADLAREELILKLLGVVDNFERALQAAEDNHSYESLVEGVSLTMRQVQDMLLAEGVEPIEAVGQEFDPEVHEAVASVESDDHPDNTVVDELQKGYTLNGKVLRPSRVRVSASQ